MFLVENQKVPLCLDCYTKYAAVMQLQTENYERELNYLSDQIAHSVGMPPLGPRYPERRLPQIIGNLTLNNIKVSGGVVGSINTGSIGRLDVTITAIKGTGQSDLAEALTRLSEAVIASVDLAQLQRDEMVELLGALASEIATPPEQRRNSIGRTLLARLRELISGAADLTTIWQQWGPSIIGVFGG
jgi:hypothetical protein